MAVVLLGALLAGAGCPKRTTRAPAPEGRLGVWVDSLPEGAVVRRVAPGSGAYAAGITEGDLLLSMDGVPVEPGPAPGRKLRGAVGTTVMLRVAGPLGAAVRTVPVTRGPVPLSPQQRALRQWRRAASDPSTAQAALTDLLATHPAAPPTPINRTLVVPILQLRRTKQAPDVPALLQQMADQWPQDPEVQAMAGTFFLQDQRRAEAMALLDRARGATPPGLTLPSGVTVDTAAALPWRRTRLQLTVAGRGPQELDDAQAVLQEARLLQALGFGDAVPRSLGLAPERRPRPVRVPVPATRPATVRGLDGARLPLAADQPVVLSFWATWCGPCKRELPALEAWAQAHPEVQVVAVSTDQGARPRAIASMGRKLGLDTVQIAHDVELATSLEVRSVPQWWLYGVDGGLRGTHTGYRDAEGMAPLDRALDQAGEGLPVATTTGAVAYSQVVQAGGDPQDLLERGGEVWVAGTGVVPHRAGEPAQPSRAREPNRHLGWAGGPVLAEGHAVRAWTEDGRPRWMRTVPGAVQGLLSVEAGLWVATDAGVAFFGPDGAGTWTEGPATWALAAGDAPGELRRATSGRAIPARGALGEAHLLGRRGSSADGSVRALADSDGWTAARTTPTHITVFSRDGVALGRVQTRRPAGPLLAHDVDGDGEDELLVGVERVGVLAFTVTSR